MNFANIKLPIAVVGLIIAQAFGLIWYVAQLDSTVKQLQTTVEEVRLNTAETSVAVIQNDIANIKINLAKLEQSAGLASEPFDDADIWEAIEDMVVTLEGISSTKQGVTSKELKAATQELSTKLQNILDGKGATWKKSTLQARIEAMEKAIAENHPPKKKKNK